MKYNYIINQKALMDSGMRLNIVQACLLEYLIEFSHCSKKKQLELNSQTYIWINYQHIIENNPLLELNKNNIKKHLDILTSNGLIILHKEKDNSIYYHLTAKIESIYFDADNHTNHPANLEVAETPIPKSGQLSSKEDRTVTKSGQPLSRNRDSTSIYTNQVYTPTSIVKEINKEKTSYQNSVSQKFQPPTLEEIQTYCQQRQNSINPEQFLNFYTAKGWMMGKNKMKDWQAAIRTWEQHKQSTHNSNSNHNPYANDEWEVL